MSRRRQAKAPLLSASTKASLLVLAAAAAVAWAVLWRDTAATERVPPSHERRSRSEPDESRRSRSEPSRAAKPVPACFDKDPARCASMRASCKDSPGWMFVNCAATCNACEMLDPAVRCRLDRFNQTSGLPEGGLDALFERMIQTADGQVEVLSRPPDGPWIVTIDGFLSDAQMEALVTTTMGKMERSTDDGAVSADGEVAKEVSSRRTSSNAWCMAGCEADRHVRALSGRIEALTGIRRQHYEQYQVLRYDPSQRYVRHHDYVPRPGQTFAEPHGPRVLTIFLYLSDVESGGETAFTDLSPPIAILPKRGRALVWPSVLADDPTTQDARTHHEARPVGRGVKLAANTWIHLHDYRLPNLWGCTGSFE